VVLATFSLSLSGCGKNEAQEASGMPSAPPASVRIGYFANATHAQAVLEVASGDLAKALAPSQLTSRVFNAGPSLVEALFGGEIDLGYLGPGPAINAFVKSHGQGIRVIAGAAANGVLIVARPDAGINTLADLKGKRIATPQVGNTQDISCRHYMTQVLHQSDLGNVLPVSNAEQAAMLARGQIDAAWSPEPWGSRLVQETGAKVIAHEKDLWPEHQFILTVVVTTPQFLQEHPDIVEKMLKVHRTWTARLQQEPDRYVAQLDDALATLTGKRLPKGILSAALANIQFTDEPLEPTLKTFSQWTYDLGFSRRQADLSALTDLTFLHRV
jgi:NitT/TauT family transport system substrate-binding protein